jgi:hypothetical protein
MGKEEATIAYVAAKRGGALSKCLALRALISSWLLTRGICIADSMAVVKDRRVCR